MTTTETERSYTHIDKTDWDDGPWQEEPDKLQWVDEATGLDCLIVRNTLGALCGYVGVPPEHPWHGREYSYREDPEDYETSPESQIDVHGGLTYSASCQEDAAEREGICHVPAPGRPKDVWWFGFDCAHSGDVVPAMEARERAMSHVPIRLPYAGYRHVPYVRSQCTRLAHQLAAVALKLGGRCD